MLDDSQITETEAIFLTLDSGDCTDELCNELIEYVMNKSEEQYIYLRWLLLRWSHLRKHQKDLPKKRLDLNTCIQMHTRKKQRGDFYCTNCGDLQFKKNTHCRLCGCPNPFIKNSFYMPIYTFQWF